MWCGTANTVCGVGSLTLCVVCGTANIGDLRMYIRTFTLGSCELTSTIQGLGR